MKKVTSRGKGTRPRTKPLNMKRNMTGQSYRLLVKLPQANRDVLFLHQLISGASVSQKETPGSTGLVPSFAHSSVYDQLYGGVCVYPPESEDIPFGAEQHSETERSGTLSDSDDDQFSDSAE